MMMMMMMMMMMIGDDDIDISRAFDDYVNDVNVYDDDDWW